MRHTLETYCDSLLNAINVSIDSVEKGSTKYDGTKAILCSSKDEEISRILRLTTQDFYVSQNSQRSDSVSIS